MARPPIENSLTDFVVGEIESYRFVKLSDFQRTRVKERVQEFIHKEVFYEYDERDPGAED